MKHYPAFIMHGYLSKTSLILSVLLLASLFAPRSSFAENDEDIQILRLFYHDNDLVVSATRSEKSISQVAENISIVTAEEIEAMNAHTVADVLNHVTGLQLMSNPSAGAPANLFIQGANYRHCLVMIDGVSQSNLGDGFPDIGAMRVQQIERIEIIKGPASSSWGSSLGGIVNIITKSADETRPFGGTLSASIGSRGTGDYRAAVSGTIGSLGYYLSGGGLLSDGLRPTTMLDSGNIYSKLELRPTDSSTLTLTVGYDSGSRGLTEDWPYVTFRNYFNNFFATLALKQTLSRELVLDLSLRGSIKHTEIEMNDYVSGDELQSTSGDDRNFGGSARLMWKQQRHTMILGTDFDLGALESTSILNGMQHLDKWAIYANDTLKLGRFSITPGIRYDYTSTNGDFLSPSLGATCTIADSTIIRAYVARGFSIPPLGYTFGTGIFSVPNHYLKMEKVWSYSAGFETAALKYVWLKTTYFRHDVSDALATTVLPTGYFTYINSGKQRREGVEVELKTVPLFNVSLTGGFTFINIKDRTTGEVEKNAPRFAYDVGILFDDSRFFRASLKGRYTDWNAVAGSNAKYSAMIWDINLSRKFNLSHNVTAEAFFSAHNLFNGAQYLSEYYKNPRRWFEGGLRFSF